MKEESSGGQVNVEDVLCFITLESFRIHTDMVKYLRNSEEKNQMF